MVTTKRRSEWMYWILLAVVLVAGVNFWLSRAAIENREAIEEQQHRFYTTEGGNGDVRLPILVVGFPKVGTTSIHASFVCGGYRSSHYCCCGSNRTHTHCDGGPTFSDCMRANKKAQRPILEGCGDYDVYAQMDAELGSGIYLPQHFDLELLHEYAPEATLLLNVRPAEAWMKSVTNWYGLGGRFLRQFKIDVNKVERNKALEEIFENHTTLIRDFVATHPSHTLVEVDISNPSAGETMAQAFGIPSTCWGVHNQNKRMNKTILQ